MRNFWAVLSQQRWTEGLWGKPVAVAIWRTDPPGQRLNSCRAPACAPVLTVWCWGRCGVGGVGGACQMHRLYKILRASRADLI